MYKKLVYGSPADTTVGNLNKEPQSFNNDFEHETNTAIKPPRGVEIRRRVPILKSKEMKLRHAKIQEECGLDSNLRPIEHKSIYNFEEGMANNPKYYQDVLGDTMSLSWEEL